VIVDEGGIVLNSRESMSNINKLFSKLLFIRRHKEISILFIVQNSGNIDINTIKQSSYLIFKKFELLQKNTERKIIKDIYEKIEDDFKNLYKEYRQKLSYIYSEEFTGFVTNELPSYWSEKVSKGFKGIELAKK
jgi:hypothetical protein